MSAQDRLSSGGLDFPLFVLQPFSASLRFINLLPQSRRGPPRYAQNVATAKIFDVEFHLPARMRWKPDGRAVTYIARQNGLSDIWSQPIDGGEPKRLTNFKADEIFSFDCRVTTNS